MDVVKRTKDDNVVLFWCPGCEEVHQVWLDTWSWNNSLSSPTFSPSLLVNGTQWDAKQNPEFHKTSHLDVEFGETTTCHSFVSDGQIQFLDDCTHVLAGQTVPLPNWPVTPEIVA